MPRLSRSFCPTARRTRLEFSKRSPQWSATWRSGAGQDLAVVMFSGHGTMIDGQFYLVPYGADNSTPARLKASAIPATEFQSEITKLAQHGRVLVLLDACRSAGLIGALPAAEVLKSVLAASNVTVLTSSTADKLSREDEKWEHGAFTKVLLDALSGSADDIDIDHNGVISMSRTDRLYREAPVEVDWWRSATRARSAFPGRHLRCRVVGEYRIGSNSAAAGNSPFSIIRGTPSIQR